MIDQRQIAFAKPFVKLTIGLGEEVVHFDFNIRRDAGEAIADAAGGAVVTLSKAGGEDEDSFFHNSSDTTGGREADEV